MSEEMTYAHLGRSGLMVSRIGLGTMNFGYTVDEPSSFAVMDAAIGCGYQLLRHRRCLRRSQSPDMKKGYGIAEQTVGRWLGEVCEYRLERGRPVRRTAMLIHLQKRVLRAPEDDVLAAERYWILPNRFAVQDRITPWAVRAARIPHGHEMLPFYVRRVQRWRRRRATRRAADAGLTTVQV